MTSVQREIGRDGFLGCLGKSWLGCLGLLGFPLFVLVGLGFVVPAATLSNMRRSRRLLREMTLAGRILSWEDLPKSVEPTGGTLIHDWPYWGWSGDHVWWMPEDIQARSDAPPWGSLDSFEKSAAEMNALARLSRWIAAQYFGPTSGAFLIHASGSRRGSKDAMRKVVELRARYPNLKFVKISSTLEDHFVEDGEFEVSGP